MFYVLCVMQESVLWPILRYIYKMERIGANRSMLWHDVTNLECKREKPILFIAGIS